MKRRSRIDFSLSAVSNASSTWSITEVSHDVFAYAPIVSVADRHELLQPLGRLLRDAVVVVMRIGIDIASQRRLQSHAAVVEDLDAGKLQPVVTKSGRRAVTGHDRFPRRHVRRRLRPEHQTRAESGFSRNSDLLKRPDVPSFRRSLDHARNPEAVQDTLGDLELPDLVFLTPRRYGLLDPIDRGLDENAG